MELWQLFHEGLPEYIKEIASSLLPIVVMFGVFQAVALRLDKRTLGRIAVSAAEGLESLPESLREAITIAAQSDFIAKELPVPLMNKYFEYQTQLCHGYESAPDPQAWERENCFLKI